MKARKVDDFRRAFEINELRLAFERIPYFLVLKAMIVRFFFDEIREVPAVVFQRLPGSALAQASTRCERYTCRGKILPLGPSVIYIDTMKFAKHQLLGGGRTASLLAILAHELLHVYLHQCAGLKGIHSATFWTMASVVNDFGCPVAQDGWHTLKASTPAPRSDWRRSLAIILRPPMAIEVRR